MNIEVAKKNVVRKIKINPQEPVPEPFNQSIWLLMRRAAKEKPLPIVWEHIEDISDDEEDTPQAAGKRLSKMKKTAEQIRRRLYEIRLDELQGAGLFLNW
jgi:hypothetical protein